MTEKVNSLLATPTTTPCMLESVETKKGHDGRQKYKNARIRRFTPAEVARLQTVPDWYEWVERDMKTGADKPTSDTQVYRMCGNGWTIEVIKHFFSFIPESVTGVKPLRGNLPFEGPTFVDEEMREVYEAMQKGNGCKMDESAIPPSEE